MSDPQHDPHPHPGHAHIPAAAHEGPIRTPKQLLTAVFFAFVVPVALIVLLVLYAAGGPRPAAGADAFTADAVARRLEPVGAVIVKDSTDVSTLKTGEQVFAGQCTTCHSAGLVGAPKLGDSAAWAPRIATGYPALVNSALHGKGNMGPQGGGDYADLEVARAVVYMANKAGATFPEPKSAPEAGATSTPASVASPASAAAIATAGGAANNASPAATAAAERLAAAAPTAAGAIVAAEPARADAPTAVAPALFAQVCQACHVAGVAGAPKLGDKAAWGPRIAAAGGVDGLTASAIKGKGAMPPRGGSTASDADIRTVVSYMVNSAK